MRTTARVTGAFSGTKRKRQRRPRRLDQKNSTSARREIPAVYGVGGGLRNPETPPCIFRRAAGPVGEARWEQGREAPPPPPPVRFVTVA